MLTTQSGRELRYLRTWSALGHLSSHCSSEDVYRRGRALWRRCALNWCHSNRLRRLAASFNEKLSSAWAISTIQNSAAPYFHPARRARWALRMLSSARFFNHESQWSHGTNSSSGRSANSVPLRVTCVIVTGQNCVLVSLMFLKSEFHCSLIL